MDLGSDLGVPAAGENTAIAEFSAMILGELDSGKLELPILPEVTLRVSDLTEDPNASLSDLAELIVTDVTLSSQLIKVSNSPLYRGRDPVDNVPMAVSRLGFSIVKNLVSSLAMQQMFKATSSWVEERQRLLWRLNVDIAARSRVLASRVPLLQEDEAMLAGLIHNIGVLPILVKISERPELMGEKDLLTTLIANVSAPVGAAVLRSWDFSDRLVAVVAQFRNFTRDSEDGPDLVDVVQVASLQSPLNAEALVAADEYDSVPAFGKLGIQTDVQVTELDEDSDEYAEALALFS